MIPLTKIEQQYWQAYLATLRPNEVPQNPWVEASFAGSHDVTDELLQLYLQGKKMAGSSLAEDFIAAGDPLPKPGNFWIYLNSQNQPSCILRTEKVVFDKFSDVPLEIALAEGEGDLSLDYWRKVHTAVYSPFLSQWGLKNIEDATVITEYFQIVYR